MSKMKMATVELQDIVSRAAKGASENRLLPITSLIAVDLQNGVLTLTTTDTANTLKVIAKDVEGDNFSVVVPVSIFSKLIDKLTSEYVTFKLTDSSIEVIGNGNYNIPFVMDEDGLVKFPEYTFEKTAEPEIVSLASVHNILNINKAAVAVTVDAPYLCGYYFGDKVITTNEQVICFNDLKLFKEDVLISTPMMDLLGLNTEENIKCYYNDGYFLFETSNVIVYGAEQDNKELFPVNEVMGYLDEEFNSVCTLPKILFQDVIDRLSLFVEPYDKNGAYFTFDKDSVRVTSKQSSSVEIIKFLEVKDFEPFVCCIDISLLQSQINANLSDNIELWFGHNAAIKITSDKVTQVIALLEDDSLEHGSGY